MGQAAAEISIQHLVWTFHNQDGSCTLESEPKHHSLTRDPRGQNTVPPTQQGPASAQQAQGAESEYTLSSLSRSHLATRLAHMLSIFDKSRHTHTLPSRYRVRVLTTHRSEFSRAVFRNYGSGAGGQRPHRRPGRACPINLSTARTVRPARLLQLFSASQSLASCLSLPLSSSDVGFRIAAWATLCLFPKRPLVAVAWQFRSSGGQDPRAANPRGSPGAWRTT